MKPTEPAPTWAEVAAKFGPEVEKSLAVLRALGGKEPDLSPSPPSPLRLRLDALKQKIEKLKEQHADRA